MTIPNSVTMIDGEAFCGCTGLTSVTIGNSVTTIGESAFKGCSGITSVTIPNSVTTIDGEAFSGCSGITSVTIGNSVTTIDGNAFVECTALKAVQVLATTPPSCGLGYHLFSDDTYSQATLYIPKGCLDAYRSNWPWNQFHNIVGSSFIKGDVDLDETVDTGDATIIVNHLLNAKSVPHFSADINGDNQVDISDVTAIISIILSE